MDQVSQEQSISGQQAATASPISERQGAQAIAPEVLRTLQMTPAEIAQFLDSAPRFTYQVFSLLHRERGNAFAQRVLDATAALHGQQRIPAATRAPAASQTEAAVPATTPTPSSTTAPASTPTETQSDADTQAPVSQEETPAAAASPAASAGPLAAKAEMLLQWKAEMQEVAGTVTAPFADLGLDFRAEILLATAMQEASASNPQHAVSFDNGLGIMQITPYAGDLSPEVAAAIGWNNRQSVKANIRNSNWRDARANLLAGAYTMLDKAKALARGASTVWETMTQSQRWRAIMFAYNAGEGTALRALRSNGPNARMISRFRGPRGRMVEHDYTEEFAEKLAHVESAGYFQQSPSREGES